MLYRFIIITLIRVTFSQYSDSSTEVSVIGLERGGPWISSFLPNINIDIAQGPAAEIVLNAPLSHMVCLSLGESLDPKCQGIYNMETGKMDRNLQPLMDGVTLVSAWIQSKHDKQDISSTIGKPFLVYLWDTPEDAIQGLSRRLAYSKGYEKSVIELHLSVAHAQVASTWAARSLSHDSKTSLENIISTDFKPLVVDKSEIYQDIADESLHSLLNKVALVTISNAGYTELTRNCLASLRVKCGLPCVLQVFCVDEKCTEVLRASREARDCPHTIHSIESGAETPQNMQTFSTYKQNSFNSIVKYKFVAIYERLLRYEYVLFTDGDVVFLNPDFLSYMLTAVQNQDLVIQCDLMGPVVSKTACFTPLNVTHSNGAVTTEFIDYLCTGFMMIRATENSLYQFNIDRVLNDPFYKDHFHDQEYFNWHLKHQVKYSVLSQSLFPNGSPYAFSHDQDPSKYPPPANPYIIHFNYFPGKTKPLEMKKRGYWFLDEDDEM